MEERGRRPKRSLAERNKKIARERALVILQVRSGALTAKEGAELLGLGYRARRITSGRRSQRWHGPRGRTP